MSAREAWREHWRYLRIMRRESALASADLALFGSAYVLRGPLAHQGVQHIPLEKVRIDGGPACNPKT